MGALTGQSPWRLSWRDDPAARAVADRHYNRQHVGASGFVPPGSCLVLKTETSPVTRRPWAVWVTSWPQAQWVKHRWAGAWINTLYRREGGPGPASELIRWAVAHSMHRWPDVPPLGIVTFVDPAEVASEVPGYCYLRAGWRHVGQTVDDGYLAFQLTGARMLRRERPVPVPGSQLTLDEAMHGKDSHEQVH